MLTPNGNHYNQQQQSNFDKLIENVTPIGPLRPKGQFLQTAMTKQTLEDGNVLKKVISFTLEQMNNGDNLCKSTRPIFVPEKLRFSEYNQFEGKCFAFKLGNSYSSWNIFELFLEKYILTTKSIHWSSYDAIIIIFQNVNHMRLNVVIRTFIPLSHFCFCSYSMLDEKKIKSNNLKH